MWPRPLTRKLLRECWTSRAQLLAIALVLGSGVTTLVTSLSTLDTLRATRSAFYSEYRFADVFANLKRAPESVRSRLAEIPGVQTVETRVVGAARLHVDGFGDPVNARLTSLPDGAEPVLNRLYLRAGRLPAAGSTAEAVVSEAFAGAHGLPPGDHLEAVINGRERRIRIVGIGLSPEYVYQIKPGDLFPDYRRYAVLWMDRDALEAAYDMDGAFNDVAATLAPGGR
ncbi:MAG TPA: ABC transporter permease, partial [Gammaproteobacteria bacterium]|nr:ABC transporter permease [Gammaproteobacteria bacterium]